MLRPIELKFNGKPITESVFGFIAESVGYYTIMTKEMTDDQFKEWLLIKAKKGIEDEELNELKNNVMWVDKFKPFQKNYLKMPPYMAIVIEELMNQNKLSKTNIREKQNVDSK